MLLNFEITEDFFGKTMRSEDVRKFSLKCLSLMSYFRIVNNDILILNGTNGWLLCTSQRENGVQWYFREIIHWWLWQFGVSLSRPWRRWKRLSLHLSSKRVSHWRRKEPIYSIRVFVQVVKSTLFTFWSDGIEEINQTGDEKIISRYSEGNSGNSIWSDHGDAGVADENRP